MKRGILIRENFDYQVDIDRIVKIFEDRDIRISAQDAHDAWADYSDSLAAGWLFLDEDDDLVFETLRYKFNVED